MEINIAGYIERHGSDLSQIRKGTTVQRDMYIVAVCIRKIYFMYVCVSSTYLYNNLYLHNHLLQDVHSNQHPAPSSCSRNVCEMDELKRWVNIPALANGPAPLLLHPLYACDDSALERHIYAS